MTAPGWIAFCPHHHTHAELADGPAGVAAALRSAGGACADGCAATALVGLRPARASRARGWNPDSAPLARLLVLVERPELGRAGITQARRLLADPDADVLLLAVAPAGSPPAKTTAAEQALEELVAPLLEHGVRVYARVAHGSLAQQALAHAQALRAQLVVLATDAPPAPGGRAWGRDAVRLLHECPAPLLLLAEDEAHRPPRRLLVPLDGSTRADGVLPLVTAFALAHAAEVVLLRVGPDLAHPGPGPVTAVPEACARELEAGLAPALRALRDAGVRATTRLAYDSSPARAITEVAAAVEADLIALTGRGAAGWSDWPLGSAADAVVRRAAVPLLVHRAPGPAPVTSTAPPPLELAAPPPPAPAPVAGGAVVVTTDGSPLGDAAAALLPRLVPSLAASAVLLQVLPDEDGPADARREGLRAAQAHLRGLAERIARAGLPAEAHVVRGDVVERILADARPPGARLLVMASHGRSGASRVLRGSVAERVLRRAEVPVLVVTPAAIHATDLRGPRFERLLLADDGTPAAARALALVGELARAHDGQVTLLGVAATSVDVGPLVRSLREHAACVGDRARIEVVVGDPAAEIVRAAAAADLVVTSTHGRGGLARAWLGSVTEEVLRRVDRPLLVVHA